MDKPMPADNDNEELINHVALECMHAINSGDHQGFMDAHHVLMAHTLSKMSDEMESKE